MDENHGRRSQQQNDIGFSINFLKQQARYQEPKFYDKDDQHFAHLEYNAFLSYRDKCEKY